MFCAHGQIQVDSRLEHTIPDFINCFHILSNVMSMRNFVVLFGDDVKHILAHCHSFVGPE